MRTRAFWVLAAVTVLLAGAASWLAYSRPDALEHGVAAYVPDGSANTADAGSATAEYRVPMPDYTVPPLQERPGLSSVVAGLAGVSVTFALLLVGGTLLKRRGRSREVARNG